MSKFSKLIWIVLLKMRIASAVDVARKMGVTVGDGCKFLDNPFRIFGSEPYLIKIGNNVELTNGVKIVTHDGGLWVLRNLYDDFKKSDFLAPVIIGNNVFIGNNSIILPGVKIGDNVVVGAGSVVTKNIKEGTVVCGVPAKQIKDIEDYKNDKKEKVIESKGLTFLQKKNLLKSIHPEWFGVK